MDEYKDTDNKNDNEFNNNPCESSTDGSFSAPASQTPDAGNDNENSDSIYSFSKSEIKQDPVFNASENSDASSSQSSAGNAYGGYNPRPGYGSYNSDAAHQERTYTPPNYSGYNQGYQPYTQQPNPPRGYRSPVTGKGKPKKEKIPKPVTRGSLVAACISAAVAASLLTGILFSFGSGVGKIVGNESSTGTSTASSAGTASLTTIVADTTAETTVEAVADKVGSSVVGVVVTTSTTSFFYGNSESTSEGSGIIYSQDGYIITNYHVISNAVESSGKMQVYLPSDSSTGIDATVIGYDVSSDLAVIKIDKSGLPAVEIGDSDAIKVGQTAIAIGNPGGMDFMGSVSSGIISGLNRVIQLENTQEINLIQTDAAINPGNSGGALCNSSGQLIGVNSAKMASSDYEGMGFAIPVNSVVEICNRIIENKDKPAPYVGIELSTYYTSDQLNQMGYPSGVVVSAVTSGSPAGDAGIQRGDIITEFNGTAVSSYSAFNSEKQKYDPGETVSLSVYRSGRTYTVNITLGTANE